MGRHFSVQRGATRIVFGAGSARKVPRELDALGARKALIVCTPGRAGDAAALSERLGARSAGTFAGAREHVPAQTANEAQRMLDASGADAVLALGGGSAIGLAKALALRATRPHRSRMPTTYSGSEMTPMYGITEGGAKRTGRDERVRPALVVYDPALTASLPRDVTMTSLWNAMAHAVEALWVNDTDRAARTPSPKMRCDSSRRACVRLAARLDDEDAREDALEGAYLAGGAFSDAGAGLHHKLCHVLGGHVRSPPRRDARRRSSRTSCASTATRRPRHGALARALGVLDPVAGLVRLAARPACPGPRGLGMPRDGLARVVDAHARDAAAPPAPARTRRR